MLSYLVQGQTYTDNYKLVKINYLNLTHEEKTIFTWQNTPSNGLNVNSIFTDSGTVNFVYTLYSYGSGTNDIGTGTIIWGDELSGRKKELGKYMLPWCGTDREYISQSVIGKETNNGQVLVNNYAGLAAIINDGQFYRLKFSDSLITFCRVLASTSKGSIFVIYQEGYNLAFYHEKLEGGKTIGLKNRLVLREDFHPYYGYVINDSLVNLSNAVNYVYKINDNRISEVANVGVGRLLNFKNDQLFYTRDTTLYKRPFDTKTNLLGEETKVLTTGYYTYASDDGNYLAISKKDSIVIYSFEKKAFVFKNYYKNARSYRTFLDSSFLYLAILENKTDLVTTSLPTNYSLSQNYPNPFNPETTMSYSIPKSEHVTLKVFDVLGREIATIVDEYKQAGTYKANFNASGLVSGVYFYQLRVGSFMQIKKMVMIK